MYKRWGKGVAAIIELYIPSSVLKDCRTVFGHHLEQKPTHVQALDPRQSPVSTLTATSKPRPMFDKTNYHLAELEEGFDPPNIEDEVDEREYQEYKQARKLKKQQKRELKEQKAKGEEGKEGCQGMGIQG